MSAAWQDALVVRDRLGQLRHADGFLDAPITAGLDPLEIAAFADTFGPMEPILSRTGQPIVTTVGDLTARHIGKRVRVGDGAGAIEGRLLNIEHDKRTTDVAIAEGDQDVADWWPAGPRDTPCEVLP